jgi:hypothetical protein
MRRARVRLRRVWRAAERIVEHVECIGQSAIVRALYALPGGDGVPTWLLLLILGDTPWHVLRVRIEAGRAGRVGRTSDDA